MAKNPTTKTQILPLGLYLKKIKMIDIDKMVWFLLNYGIYVVLAVMVLSLPFVTKNFLTYTNIRNIILQVTILGTIAIGGTFVILSGNIDLSVGSLTAMCSSVATVAMVRHGLNVWAGLALFLVIGIGVGFLHGVAVAKFKMPSILVTLATLQVLRGLSLAAVGGRSIYNLPPFFAKLSGIYLFGVFPLLALILFTLYIIGHIILSRTLFGYRVYAIGSNIDAARVCGIKVDRILILVFCTAGLFTAIASILLTARLGACWPSMGAGFELDVIAAVVIGGASLKGGKGTLVGTLCGVFLLGVINNALNLLNISPYYQYVVKGIIIFSAVLIDSLKRRISR